MPIMHLEKEGTDRKVLHNKNKTGNFDYISMEIDEVQMLKMLS